MSLAVSVAAAPARRARVPPAHRQQQRAPGAAAHGVGQLRREVLALHGRREAGLAKVHADDLPAAGLGGPAVRLHLQRPRGWSGPGCGCGASAAERAAGPPPRAAPSCRTSRSAASRPSVVVILLWRSGMASSTTTVSAGRGWTHGQWSAPVWCESRPLRLALEEGFCVEAPAPRYRRWPRSGRGGRRRRWRPGAWRRGP